jgi:hypothetical protein
MLTADKKVLPDLGRGAVLSFPLAIHVLRGAARMKARNQLYIGVRRCRRDLNAVDLDRGVGEANLSGASRELGFENCAQPDYVSGRDRMAVEMR